MPFSCAPRGASPSGRPADETGARQHQVSAAAVLASAEGKLTANTASTMGYANLTGYTARRTACGDVPRTDADLFAEAQRDAGKNTHADYTQVDEVEELTIVRVAEPSVSLRCVFGC